tara:strand:- start:158 stop:742 length:585 start_codon:yes stop_codon:yes gene_type:complete
MILPPAIQKPLIDIIPLLTTAVIAPHGMTDLIHAETNDKVLPLFRINMLCVAGAIALHMVNMDLMTNVAFMTSSAIHFRHDFPIKNEFLKLCASSILVMNSRQIGAELFICYMCFIHVPNHYKTYESMIRENIMKSGLYIGLCAIVSTLYFYSDPNIMQNENLFVLSQALIISHIVYEELYTKNNTVISTQAIE